MNETGKINDYILMSKEEKIKEYVKKHPDALRKEIAEATGTSFNTVRVYLGKCEQKGRINKSKKDIENYLKEHPHATRAEIKEALGYSFNTIRQVLGTRTSGRNEYKRQLVKEYLVKNPKASMRLIMKRLDVSNTLVKSVMKEINEEN